jgi:hypothetical protein
MGSEIEMGGRHDRLLSEKYQLSVESIFYLWTYMYYLLFLRRNYPATATKLTFSNVLVSCSYQ